MIDVPPEWTRILLQSTISHIVQFRAIVDILMVMAARTQSPLAQNEVFLEHRNAPEGLPSGGPVCGSPDADS